MDSTGEILNSIVTDYENILSLPVEQLLNKSLKIRQSILRVINQHLLNTSQISMEIKKAKGQTSQTQTILRFMDHLITHFPHHVFVPTEAHCNQLSNNKKQVYTSKYIEFIFHLLSTLLQLLGTKEIDLILDDVNSLISNLLDLTKLKNVVIYKLIMEDFVELCIKLQEKSNEMLFETEQKHTNNVVRILTKHNLIVSAKSFEDLEELQIKFSKFTNNIIPDISLFVSGKIQTFWMLILNQVETGVLPLKTNNLNNVISLLEHSEMPDKKVLDFLTYCIITLTEQCKNSLESKNNWNTYFSKSEIELYFLSVHNFLETVLCRGTFIITSENYFLSPRYNFGEIFTKQLSQLLCGEFADDRSAVEAPAFLIASKYVFLFVLNFKKQNTILPSSFLDYCIQIIRIFVNCDLGITENEQISENLAYGLYLSCISNPINCNEMEKSQCNTMEKQVFELLLKKCSHTNSEYSELLKTLRTGEFDLKQMEEYFSKQTNLLHLFLELVLTGLVLLKTDSEEAHIKSYIQNINTLNIDEMLLKILEMFVLLVKHSKNQSNLQVSVISKNLYGKVVKFLNIFVMLNHVVENEIRFCSNIKNQQELLNVISSVLSIPWLEDNEWQDLKPGSEILIKKDLFLISKNFRSNNFTLQDDSSLNIVQNCLTGLTFLSKSCCPSWRCYLLSKWGLENQIDQLVKLSLNLIPYLCSKLTLNVTLMTPILYKLLSCVNKKQKDFEGLISFQAFELLTTVLSGAGKITTSFMAVQFSKNCSVKVKNYSKLVYTEIQKKAQDCKIHEKYLLFFQDVEKLLNSLLKSHKHTISLEKYCLPLWRSIFGFLQYADKTSNSAIQLLSKVLSLVSKFSDISFLNSVEVSSLISSVSNSETLKWNSALVEEVDKIEMYIQSKKDLNFYFHFLEFICKILNHCQCSEKSKFTNGVLFDWSLGKICRYLCMSNSKISSTAYCNLETIFKDVVEKENIFNLNCRLICHNIIVSLLDDNLNSRPPLSVVVDISELFNIPLKNFLESNLQYLLPTIPTLQNVRPKTLDLLLTEFSKSSGRSRVDMFMQNFKYIFCFAVISGTEFSALFKFLEEHTRIKKESLILLNYGSLIQHLAAHVSVNHEKVCNAFLIIHQIKSPTSNQNISHSELLQPHFLSILTFFNGQLRLLNVGLPIKKQVFQSLICLLKLMDPTNLTAVNVKIINTLCIFQQVFAKREHAALCCKAWDTLVRCVEKNSLGGILSQVAVMLLPFFNDFVEQVSSTLEFLVVENFEYTKENFCELYFLPDHDSLTQVKARVKHYMSKKTHQNFFSTLKQVNKQISHESVEVRVYALQRLRDVLQSNQRNLQQQNTVNGDSIVIIRDLVLTLLTCCGDANAQVRLFSVKCLGEIGAIDPDRLLITSTAERKTSKSFLDADSDDFAFELFNCLVQSFLAAKPFHQDISAYAVQELLKIYDCSEDSKEIAGRRLWRRFPEYIQAVLEPHLSSRYMLKKVVINLQTLKRPLIYRKQNLTFRDWIGTFCAVLMDMTCSSLDEASKMSRIFQACSAVVRNNVNVAMFLLPYAFVEVLQCSEEYINFAVEEVMSILESTENIKNNSNTVKPSSETDSICNQQLSISLNSGSDLFQLSAQVVFTILDHITKWQKQPITATGGSLAKARQNKEKKIAKKFLDKIPQKKLAEASLRCKAHYRALLHFETYLRKSCGGKCDSESVEFLQRIFIEIDETDGVAGMVAVRGVEPSPQTQLKLLESMGALQDAAACYERVIRADPTDLVHQKGFVKCLIDLGQLSTAIKVIDGTVDNNAAWKEELEPFAIEACWRLGQWDQLEEKIGKVKNTKDWNTGVGQVLLAIQKKHWDKFDGILNNLYQNQTGPLSAASMENGSYQRGYEYILRLHLLSDIEETAHKVRLNQNKDKTAVKDILSLWKLRLQVVPKSFKTNEPMISLYRVMLPMVTHDAETCRKHLGKLWLQSSKLARKSGHISTAYGALLSAQTYTLPEYCIEHAKLFWQKGESHQALLTLQKGVKEHFSGTTTNHDPQQQKTRAKVMLLVAKLMEESSSFDSNTVLRQYKDVVAYMGEWEDSHFYCAKYYDKLMITLLGENRGLGKSHHLYYIMHHYGRSLCYGTSHIYESLTKLLTVWLDYGANAAKLEKMGKPQTREDVQRLLDVMIDLRSKLPAYIFYVAFSQLISRICHQHNPTYHELKEILVEVTKSFPQRALWSMMAISKSSLPQRASRCQEIFQSVSHKDKNLTKYVADAIKLTNKLLELCNKPVTSIQPLSINTHFKGLKKLVEDVRFSEILLPLQKFMTVTLPQSKKAMFGSQTTFNPFPDTTVHITGFDDAVDILPSLQRPKKISVKASDGTSKIFLCKPKDDLRKDARLTEFAAIVNKCLKGDTESGRRQLRIRTYAVVPLNEECGLIEWVNNMSGLRQILLPIYKQKEIYVTGKQLKACQLPVTAPFKKKLDMFRNKLLPRHPPVFHEWFLTTFPDPSAWYHARLAYARSVAVMSMVGYVLGLGDRHGENILFDSNSGEAMHVDFNCLFNKGLTLEVPEIVPFRLTHNMVDAMGPTKCEGFFRRACEVTMNVLREQREPLMSVLKTFIYDPLVEWSKRGRGGTNVSSENTGEIVNEKALSHVNDIDRRLRGIVAKNKGLPLSIEGHVHYLIHEAKDEEKLCQMYIGWAPFM